MSRYHVSRSIEINATPEKVFETVADYHTWTTWSPWLCAEPEAQVEVTPDPSSVGSVYSWSGEVVGAGELEHRQLQPSRLIEDEIRFLKPFRSTANVSFEIAPAGAGAEVTWHMRGALPWFLFWMRSQVETYIGMDYERGLRMLKELLETERILSRTRIRGVEDVGPLRVAGVRGTCQINAVGSSIEAAIAEAARVLTGANVCIDGGVISVYHKCDFKAQTFEYTSGFVLPNSAVSVPAELSSWSLPAVRALAIEHIGSYENLGNAWSAGMQYARYKKLKQSRAGMFELYRNDPHQTAPADLHTDVYLSLK